MQGLIEVLNFGDGTAVGRSEGAFNSRPVSDPRCLPPPGVHPHHVGQLRAVRLRTLTPSGERRPRSGHFTDG
jgi:hypothetical protein